MRESRYEEGKKWTALLYRGRERKKRIGKLERNIKGLRGVRGKDYD